MTESSSYFNEWGTTDKNIPEFDLNSICHLLAYFQVGIQAATNENVV